MLRSIVAVSAALCSVFSLAPEAHAGAHWRTRPRTIVVRAPLQRWGYVWRPRYVAPPAYAAPSYLYYPGYYYPPPPPSYAAPARPRTYASASSYDRAPSYPPTPPAPTYLPPPPAPPVNQIHTKSASRASATQAGLVWPVEPVVISSGFGMRSDPINGEWGEHPGVDINADFGQVVGASAAGVVTRVGWVGGYGLHVEVTHADGLVTSYSHLSRILVRDGEQVQARTPVGRVGSTGHSTAPHLHFEVIRDGQKVDPVLVMPEAPQESVPGEGANAWR